MSLERRTPLRRTGGLNRGRKRLAPVSERKRAAREAAQPVIDAVFARDGVCLASHRWDIFGSCRGRMTPHHLRKQSQGGEWTAECLVSLCEGHNGWVEDHPRLAHGIGLVARSGEDLASCWARMRVAGLVRVGGTP